MNARSFALPLLALCFCAPGLAQEEQPRRSVIYFIGDGMGTDQVTLGRLAAKKLGRAYGLDRFREVGLVSTHSANFVVTDSAAGATALACGAKTNNQVIGLAPDGRRLQSVLEAAHACGYLTGLATTTRITHATPAAFAAHVQHRKDEPLVAEQLAARGFPEVLVGGGRIFFPKERLARLEEQGYAVVTDPQAFLNTEARIRAGRPRLAAILAPSHLPYRIDGGPRVSLRDIARKAVAALSATGRPFFLMVEGGRIDHAGHMHDAATLVGEQLEFAEAVDWALDRAVRDPNLLVVVTADHATGSLGISEKTDVSALLEAKASAEALVRRAGKLVDPAGRERLRKLVLESHGVKLSDADLERIAANAGNKYHAPTVLGHLLSAARGVHFYSPELQEAELTNTHGHDGSQVPIYAFGPEADWFAGTYENTEVPKKIVGILDLSAGVEAQSPLAPKSVPGRPRTSKYFK
ncbi:MAG: alkaline phosphatase [Planctomycetota bacterium]|nr:MAG: alkaline phosphatase [Planctomycetota bacterium]